MSRWDAAITCCHAAAAANADRISRGISVALAFVAAIDMQTAAAGDMVSAHLVSDAVDKKSKRVIAKAGALAEGRIVRLEHQWTPPAQFLVAIEWHTLEIDGARVPFAAKLDSNGSSFTVSVADLAGKNPPIKPRNLSGGPSLIFYTTESTYTVPAGFELHWVTMSAPTPAK